MSLELETIESENIGLGKPVCLPELYAMGLQRLAIEKDITESVLLQKALDGLFHQEMDADTYSEWACLKEWEAEFGPMPPRHVGRGINTDDIVSVVSTPIDPKTIRRRGESR